MPSPNLASTDFAELQVYLTALADADRKGLSLIASENYPALLSQQLAASDAVRKNSEGYPAHVDGEPQFYSTNPAIDAIQATAIDKACSLFGSRFANVQPFSGSNANLAVLLALTKPGDTILSATFESGGGHFTHASGSHIAGSRMGVKVVHYGVNASGRIDLDDLAKKAKKLKPKLIVVGGSGYPRQYDFAKMAKIAHSAGALFWVDMAQIAGLVAGGAHPSPFPHADVVTSSTQKTLGGLRGGFILWNDPKLSRRINDAVFPGIQGEPDNAKIAAAAAIFYIAKNPTYKKYCAQVLKNAQALAGVFLKNKFRLTTGGTDNHLMIVDLRPTKLGGKQVADALLELGMPCNQMPVAADKAGTCSGLRLGTPAGTTRGLKEKDFVAVGQIVVDTIHEMAKHKGTLPAGAKTALKKRVRTIAEKFPPPPSVVEVGDASDIAARSWTARAKKDTARELE